MERIEGPTPLPFACAPEDLEGFGWLERIGEGDRKNALEALRLALRRGRPFRAPVRLTDGEGGALWYEVRALPDPERASSSAIWHVELSDVDAFERFDRGLLRLGNELRTKIVRRNSLLRLAHHVTRIANRASSFLDGCALSARRVRAHGRWDRAIVWLRSIRHDDRFHPVFEAQPRGSGDEVETVPHSISFSRDPAFERAVEGERALQVVDGDVVRILVPVVGPRGTTAVLEFATDPLRYADDPTLAVLDQIGYQLGHLYTRIDLERRVAASAEDQRTLLGRELHDSVGQEVSGVAMSLGAVTSSLRDRGAPELDAVDRLETRLHAIRKRLRAIAHGLLPVEIEADGLVRALEALAEDHSAVGGLECSFVAPTCDVPACEPSRATHLYRIAQEATANALRHADAKSIEITLQIDERFLTLEVRDDGRADVARGSRESKRPWLEGAGIRSMRHRAEELGGRLSILHVEPRGTEVRCRVPLEELA